MSLTLPAWPDLIGLPVAVIALGLFSLGLGWMFYQRVVRRLAALDKQIATEQAGADAKTKTQSDAKTEASRATSERKILGEAPISNKSENMEGAVIISGGQRFSAPSFADISIIAADGTKMVLTPKTVADQKFWGSLTGRKAPHSNILPARPTPRGSRDESVSRGRE